jgi:hypothetical protein
VRAEVLLFLLVFFEGVLENGGAERGENVVSCVVERSGLMVVFRVRKIRQLLQLFFQFFPQT